MKTEVIKQIDNKFSEVNYVRQSEFKQSIEDINEQIEEFNWWIKTLNSSSKSGQMIEKSALDDIQS